MTDSKHATSRLAELRAQAGISQGTLSKLSGVHGQDMGGLIPLAGLGIDNEDMLHTSISHFKK